MLHIVICLIMVIVCGAFSVNLTGYYELDMQTKLIRSVFFIIAVICSIIIGTII
jgi:hypothetical protein